MPVGLALGISIGARHDDWLTRSQTSRWTSGNTEVSGYTDLINQTRHDARDQLRRDVRALGAEGVVIQSMDMQVGEHECPSQEGARDHVAEVTIIGTAITHFAKSTGRSRATEPGDLVARPAAQAGGQDQAGQGLTAAATTRRPGITHGQDKAAGHIARGAA